MIIVVLRLEAQSSNIIFVPIDIVAVLGVFILPPYLAMLMMSLFYFTTQFFTNPRFQWSTEIMNRLMYGLCTGAVGGIVTAAYHLWGIQTASWQLFILMMIGIMTFYATNISIAGLWQKYIKNIPFEQFLKQVHAGFPLHNFVAAPVAYVIVISYQAKLLGGWGGWTMMAISFPIFYAHYISTKQTYALQSAHQKIRDNEQILRSLTEGLPIGVYRVQPDGKFISANRTMAHMLGYSNVDELLSHNTLDFYVDPSQRERLREKRLKNKDVTAAIIHIKRRDGSLIWVRDTVRITYTPEGDVAYVDGALEDITEQRRIELALEETNRLIRKAKQEWETTVDSLPHFVCLLDGELM
jgi:PAS domain S-box-containing protein